MWPRSGVKIRLEEAGRGWQSSRGLLFGIRISPVSEACKRVRRDLDFNVEEAMAGGLSVGVGWVRGAVVQEEERRLGAAGRAVRCD